MTELGVLDNEGFPKKIKLLTPGSVGNPSDTVMSAQGIKGMVPFDCQVLNWPELFQKKILDIAGTVDISKSSVLNLSKINGHSIETGTGKAERSLRVVLADDGPAIKVNAAQDGEWVFKPNGVLETSINQISGSPVSTGNGKADSGTQRIVIADDNKPIEVNLSKPIELSDKTIVVQPYSNEPVDGATKDIKDTQPVVVISGACFITQALIVNSHKSVGTWVNLLDGEGRVRHTVYAGPLGGGGSSVFPSALKIPGGLFAECETKGANVRVSASGYTTGKA